MKILLTNLPGPYIKSGSRWAHYCEKKTKDQYFPFPFNLAYSAAILLRAGIDTDIKDCITLGWDTQRFYEYMDEFCPDVLVVETSTPSYLIA